jgi:S-adenosylmethionine-dependent methyltransferase
MRSAVQRIRSLLVAPDVPRKLSARFRAIETAKMRRLEELLKAHYFSERPARFLETEEGRTALHDQLLGRLETDRAWFVPWVSSVRSLENLRVLEIGCGTGSSTAALAEQGANVTALDIDEGSLIVARARMDAYGLSVRIVHGNVTDFAQTLRGEPFDLIVFYASLEHMVHEERLASMRDTWVSLKPGALWCVTDTPNRLWYLDSHTSWLPFFQWLPDDLALEYTPFSPRPMIRELRANGGTANMVEFLRKGRGVSYHEFELAMAPLPELSIESCMRLHFRRQKPLRAWKQRLTLAGRYEELLARAAPEIPRAFLLPSLDILLRKD